MHTGGTYAPHADAAAQGQRGAEGAGGEGAGGAGGAGGVGGVDVGPGSVVVGRLPVGIVGGGLGGSALALSLQRRGIPVVVFEKDGSLEARRQGYALTMQQGGPALRALGLGDSLLQQGTISGAHISYRWDGQPLGQYGMALRGGGGVGV
ncbi:hypothetical protein B484DRAFT_414437, partial [Ochromonadaceae sp. CCMP2298]